MTVLRIILDNLFAPEVSGVVRYTREVTKALTETAPENCRTVGVIARHSESQLAAFRQALPTLDATIQLPASSGQLALAWNLGVPPRMLEPGLTHSPTMLAPLFPHQRGGGPVDQVVTTLHSTALWTAPETLTLRQRITFRRIIAQAEHHADAIVVTTHSAADVIDRETSLGDRLHVIPAAPTRTLTAKGAVATKADAYGLPRTFLLAFLSESAANLDLIFSAIARLPDGLPLVLVGLQYPGQTPVSRLLLNHRLGMDRVILLGRIDDEELAVVLTRARALLYFGDDDALGLSLFDAMAARTPIVYPATEHLLEVTGGAGIGLDATGPGLVDQLTDAITTVSDDRDEVDKLQQEGADRARAFSWHDTAEAIWELHAGL